MMKPEWNGIVHLKLIRRSYHLIINSTIKLIPNYFDQIAKIHQVQYI